MKTTLICGLALLAGILAGGCGNKDNDDSSGGRSSRDDKKTAQYETPKEAALALCESVEQGDKAAFLAVIQADDKEFLETMFDAMTTMRGFAADFENAYGNAEADTIKELKGDSAFPSSKAVKEKADVKINDDTARVVVPGFGTGQGLPVVKKGEYWFVDLSAKMPPADQRAGALRNFQALHKVCSVLRPKIGQNGLTGKQIVDELNEMYTNEMKPPTNP